MTAGGDVLASTVHRLAGNAERADQLLAAAAAALGRGDVAGGTRLIEQARAALWATRDREEAPTLRAG